MKDESDMPTEHCRVGVYHKMAMDAPMPDKTEDEQDESAEEEKAEGE